MLVIATADGFYAGRRIRAGRQFEVKDGAAGKWFAPVKGVAAPSAAKPRGKAKAEAGPETFSQLAQRDAVTQAPEGGGGDLV